MKSAEIYIYSAELESWPNKKTGVITEMTKIFYLIKMSNNDNKIGYSQLKCYKKGNLLSTLNPLLMNRVKADIEERPTENGSKYVLLKINGKDL